MRNRKIAGIFFALVTMISTIAPALAQQFYVNPYNNGYNNPYAYNNTYVNPYYNNYAYRGYAPYQEYGYRRRKSHTVRNVAIGAGVGALIGLLASHHGHSYRY